MKHHRGHHVNMVAVSILIFAFWPKITQNFVSCKQWWGFVSLRHIFSMCPSFRH
jgi:hypothetical protein